LDRIDAADLRKTESIQRAVRIKKDSLAQETSDGSRVRTFSYDEDPVSKIEEYSTGKRVTVNRGDSILLSHIVVDDVDGTKTETMRWAAHEDDGTGAMTSLYPTDEYLGEKDNQTVEYANGNLEACYFDGINDEYPKKYGHITHANGSKEKWHQLQRALSDELNPLRHEFFNSRF
jgi:hypothetical protein